ncbi:hypothetical protein E4U13_002786 [Claviceps humidiphila]|uniref:Fungal calcium binding protein domain-containing protein n=2 Tax=Claviceps TaxID=5110 RepID=A0A9P7SLR8_9HYPO|nr:hypothetical protein E4U57_003370 [Claviceps arundinis]KAG5962607.1 hypothetical protein E4U56_003290 [Claviceps arundinis]KAG6064746.1 hypothetical protein E4U32_008126 [Claviceps aff. humidiphila group G2b]KAG6115399.1 hypothetical protein E4U13_002786 [Claviceps humidiphila]
MQIFNIIAITFAAMATASPVDTDAVEEGVASIHLPAGCRKRDLALCAVKLIGTTAKCGSAVIEAGVNVAADLSCVISATGFATSIDKCKNCIPKKVMAIEV